MKKLSLIVLVTIATMLFGLNGITVALGESAYVSVPGNSLVLDWENDFLLQYCNEQLPDAPCSLAPSELLPLPGWMDIKKAQIKQLGNGMVELSITLYEPIPETPSIPLFHYSWSFQDICIEPSLTDKYAIVVWWNANIWKWSAGWVVVSSCDPRTFYKGDPVDFKFTEDGVKVRVPLDELITNAEPLLRWNAATRILLLDPPSLHQSTTCRCCS